MTILAGVDRSRPSQTRTVTRFWVEPSYDANVASSNRIDLGWHVFIWCLRKCSFTQPKKKELSRCPRHSPSIRRLRPLHCARMTTRAEQLEVRAFVGFVVYSHVLG
jgi:hypothetical protein